MARTLEEWLAWQATLNPAEIELGLDRIATVWATLAPAAASAKIITVAGTNGKGSSVAMLAAILDAAGYRVGTYTSPHLIRYNERIRIQGVAVTDKQLCEVFERIESARDNTQLTYFEFGTLAALLIFSAAELDVVILEVGLGGRLVAVNLVDADVALITPVDLDHQDWLGTDIETIAAEKAGIIRAGHPVIYSGKSCPDAIVAHSRALSAPLFRAGKDFRQRCQSLTEWQWQGPDVSRRNLPLPALVGVHQLDNAAGVLMVLDQLQSSLPVDIAAVRQGLLHVRLAGRLQFVSGSPSWLFDVAHNAHAARALATALADMHFKGEVVAIFAVLDDKDIPGIAEAMGPFVDRWILPALQAPRARAPAATLQLLRASGITGPADLYADVSSAVEAVSPAGSADRLILVFGSFVTVGEAMACHRPKQV